MIWYNCAIMMARTQITLDPETRRRARQRAADLGVSFAEYIRQLVEQDLERPTRQADPSAVFDLGRSKGSDVARDKDDMLGEAVAGERTHKVT